MKLSTYIMLPLLLAVEPGGMVAQAGAPAIRRSPTDSSIDTVGVLDWRAELEMAPTAGEWASLHPEWAETVGVNNPDPFDEQPADFGNTSRWCLRGFVVEAPGAADTTIARVAAAGPSRVSLQRLAETVQAPVTLRWFYFYGAIPDVPEDYALSEYTQGIDYHLANCSLGLVSAEVVGAAAPDSILTDLTAAYQAMLGEPTPTERVPYGLGPDGATTWVDGAVTVGVGPRFTGEPVSFAFLPSMGTPFSVGRNDYRASLAWEAEVFEQAIEDAALEGEAAEILSTFRAEAAPEDYYERRELILTFLRLMTARPPGVAPGTAIADAIAVRLTVADLFLQTYYRSLPSPPSADYTDFQAAMRESAQPFIDLGAGYYYTELEYDTKYFRSLADSAAAVSRPGGWGDLVQVLSFEGGCSWEGTIEAGVPLLDRIERPRFRARLNLLLGEAYATIVHFAQRGYLPDRSVEDIDETRRRAVAHYVAAIAGDLDGERKAWAWRYAFAMTHNLRMAARYSCERI